MPVVMPAQAHKQKYSVQGPEPAWCLGSFASRRPPRAGWHLWCSWLVGLLIGLEFRVEGLEFRV